MCALFWTQKEMTPSRIFLNLKSMNTALNMHQAHDQEGHCFLQCNNKQGAKTQNARPVAGHHTCQNAIRSYEA